MTTHDDRLWRLTLTLPGEPQRTRTMPRSEMESLLRGIMRGDLPTEADLTAQDVGSAAEPVATLPRAA